MLEHPLSVGVLGFLQEDISREFYPMQPTHPLVRLNTSLCHQCEREGFPNGPIRIPQLSSSGPHLGQGNAVFASPTEPSMKQALPIKYTDPSALPASVQSESQILSPCLSLY